MAEYIDKDIALNLISNRLEAQQRYSDYYDGVHCGLERALGIIEDITAADVVPVVRCRECIHYREHRTNRYKQLIRKCLRMARHDMTYHVKSDDFCSYGQRKEEEHEID